MQFGEDKRIVKKPISFNLLCEKIKNKFQLEDFQIFYEKDNEKITLSDDEEYELAKKDLYNIFIERKSNFLTISYEKVERKTNTRGETKKKVKEFLQKQIFGRIFSTLFFINRIKEKKDLAKVWKETRRFFSFENLF